MSSFEFVCKNVNEMNISAVDMHLHSYYSDGKLSPVEVVRWALRNKMTRISITDHDSVGGIDEGRRYAEECGIKYCSGIELSSAMWDRELHILGYGIDEQSDSIVNICRELAIDRQETNRQFFQIIEKDFHIREEELINSKNTSYIGKPDLARYLVKRGIFKNVDEVFDKYFSKDDIYEIKRASITAQRAVTAIKKAGGIAVLAHPVLISAFGDRESDRFFLNLKNMLKELKDMGLEGIEAIYKKNTAFEEMKLLEMANKLNLKVSKGSDFHG